MRDIDALEAILRGTGLTGPLETLRRGRSIEAASPGERVHLEVAEDYDHLHAVIDARFLVIDATLEGARQEAERIDWRGI